MKNISNIYFYLVLLFLITLLSFSLIIIISNTNQNTLKYKNHKIKYSFEYDKYQKLLKIQKRIINKKLLWKNSLRKMIDI